MITVQMTVASENVAVPMSVTATAAEIPMDLGMVCEMHNYPEYQGEYSFTPSSDEQVIETNGYALLQNITIAPIPSNYGLITWNGSTITVS